MSSLNRVTLIGRLGKDPEVRTFQNGGRVVNLRLATSERYKDRDGNQQEKTEWHAVAIFNEKLGEIAERYLQKGSLAYIEGKLSTRKWQAQDGTDRYSTEVVLSQFDGKIVLLSSRGDRDGDEERGGTRHREGSWDSGGGKGGGDTYKHPASSYRHGPGAGALDDDIPFSAEFR